MAITDTVRDNILELVVLMFDASPGPYLDDIVAVYESFPATWTETQKMAQLANLLASTAPLF